VSTTLTIRTDPELREALERRARAQDKTVSQVAREILGQALTERPLAERTGHLRGQLDLDPEPGDEWRRQIARRNRRR
jgi:predicted transcriptional regulator